MGSSPRKMSSQGQKGGNNKNKNNNNHGKKRVAPYIYNPDLPSLVDYLPKDILQRICILFLEYNEIIAFALTCKTLNECCDQEAVWKQICTRNFDIPLEGLDRFTSFKKFVRDHSGGILFGWGSNSECPFGVKVATSHKPVRIPFPKDFGQLKDFATEAEVSWFVNFQNQVWVTKKTKFGPYKFNVDLLSGPKPRGIITSISCGNTSLALSVVDPVDQQSYFYYQISEHKYSCEKTEPLAKVECGRTYAGCITKKGVLFAIGDWKEAHGKNYTKLTEIQMPNKDPIEDLAFGESTALALGKSGVYAMGSNCGVKGNQVSDHFITVGDRDNWLNTGQRVIQIGAGYCNCAVLTNVGRLYSWGTNTYGGLGRTGDFIVPQACNLDKTIISIALGGFHIHAIDTDHKVWVCGYNGAGQGAVSHHRAIENHFEQSEIPVPVHKIKATGFHTLGLLAYSSPIDYEPCGFEGPPFILTGKPN